MEKTRLISVKNFGDKGIHGLAENNYDLNAIIENIKNIILTSPGERLFEKIDYGIGRYSLFYNYINNGLIGLFVVKLNEQLSQWETRAKVTDAVVLDTADSSSTSIRIFFSVIGYSLQHFDLILNNDVGIT